MLEGRPADAALDFSAEDGLSSMAGGLLASSFIPHPVPADLSVAKSVSRTNKKPGRMLPLHIPKWCEMNLVHPLCWLAWDPLGVPFVFYSPTAGSYGVSRPR